MPGLVSVSAVPGQLVGASTNANANVNMNVNAEFVTEVPLLNMFAAYLSPGAPAAQHPAAAAVAAALMPQPLSIDLAAAAAALQLPVPLAPLDLSRPHEMQRCAGLLETWRLLFFYINKNQFINLYIFINLYTSNTVRVNGHKGTVHFCTVGILHTWTALLPSIFFSSPFLAASSYGAVSHRAPVLNSPSLFGISRMPFYALCTRTRISYILSCVSLVSYA